MAVPKTPRKKRPKDAKKQRYGKSNFFKELNSTPEGRAKAAEWRRKAWAKAGRKFLTPDGYSEETYKPVLEQAQADAKRIVEIMVEKKLIDGDDDLAKEAIGVAAEIMRQPISARDRLAAARTILDFTKQKPVQKNETAISTAEGFLESLLKQDQAKKDEQS